MNPPTISVRRHVRSFLVALFALGLTACGRRPSPVPAGPARPPVILVTLDTTRADHLGCYGYGGGTSPQIDQLAGAGVLFTRALVSASVTPVSHASIFTGLQPYTHGLRAFSATEVERLPDQAVTLAELLRGLGYQTAAFVSAYSAGKSFGLDQGFDLFDEGFWTASPEIAVPQGTAFTGAPQRPAGETTDQALRWVRQARAPFFLWVHYFDPHDTEVLPPREFLARFPTPTGPERDRLRALYDLEIRFMDEQLGRLLQGIAATAQGHNAIIIVVADHGEGLGDHGWWTHGILYEEQLRAALIIKAPGLPAGHRVGALVRTIDLLPTILDLAGIPPADALPVEGRSLVPLARGDEPDPGLVAYAESVNLMTYRTGAAITDHKTDQLFGIVAGDWKYIRHRWRPAESELYDLAGDPGERHNLLAARPDVVRRLQADLAARDYVPSPSSPASPLSPVEVERLRSLGYTR